MSKELQKVKNKIEELKKNLYTWNEAYYNTNQALVSDQVYDAAYLQLKELEAKFPSIASINSPTHKVGASLSAKNVFRKVKHLRPMLSLDNSYSQEELLKWAKHEQNCQYLTELKIDGASISLIYEQGKLKQAISRGDGQLGEDITSNAQTIQSSTYSIGKGLNNLVKT